MLRILIASLSLLSLAYAGTADAATKKKVTHHAAAASAITAPAHPNYTATRGPLWANPNECFTDEGYGRYWPCGAGKD